MTTDSPLGGSGGRAYVTYFDSGYLPRAHVLLESLRSVGEDGPVVAVCFDDESLAAMRGMAGQSIVAVPIATLEAEFPSLRDVRPQRTTAEYFFTCTPWAVLYAARQVPQAAWITYLDADVAFFSSPESIYAELVGTDGSNASAGIIAHDYLPSHRDLARFGTFNVGWVTFANDARGEKLLTWWGDQCLRWCGDEPGERGFADQGYLDHFADVVEDVRVIRLPGAHLGPWNVGSHAITPPSGSAPKPASTDDRAIEAAGHTSGVLGPGTPGPGTPGRPGALRPGVLGPGVEVDGSPLVAYHFHGLRRFGDRFVAMHLPFGTRGDGLIGDLVYAPYVRALAAAEAEVATQRAVVAAQPGVSVGVGVGASAGGVPGTVGAPARRGAKRGRGWRGAAARARRRAYYAMARLRGESWPAHRSH